MTRRILFIAVSLCILAITAVLGGGHQALAASFTVNSTVDAVDAVPGDGACATLAGQCTLRAAIQETNALPGFDVITLPAGTYALTLPGSAEDSAGGDLDIMGDVTIRGAGADRTIIDAGDIDRVFQIGPSIPGVSTEISSVTVQNGTAAGAGGISVLAGSSLTLNNSVVTGNASGIAGGIGNTGTLTLVHSTVNNNSTSSEGGGIAGPGVSTIIGSTVSGNTAGGLGGGIAVPPGGTLHVSGSTVTDNLGTGGGGIAVAGELTGDVAGVGAFTIADSTVSGNTSRTNGGGILAAGGEITNSTISGNTAEVDGGGIFNAGTMAITGTTVSHNSSGVNGGGIRNQEPAAIMTLTDSVVSDNTSANLSGGVGNGGTMTLVRTTVKGNRAEGAANLSGGGIGAAGPLTLINSTVHGNYGGGSGGGIGSFASVELVGSTVSANIVGGDGDGGGIASVELTASDSTVSGNTAARNGGGIAMATAQLNLDGVTVTDNVADANGDGRGDGGGIHTPGGTIANSDVRRNRASTTGGFGGGIYNAGPMSVADSRVAGNTSWLGGGLANFGTLELTRTLVNDNSAQTLAGVLGGGGIGSAGPLTVIDSTISGNDAVGTGGGIGSFGNATLTGSTVSGNSAGTSGGGIVSAGGALSLSNSTISGNSALENGGGITFAAESVSLNNVTVTNNRADSDANGSGDGGGINGASGVTTLANTIIAGNADGGGEAPDCAGPLFSEGYNLIQNTVGCPFVIGLGDITGQNPKLGRLANDGGPTLTHALRRGSPAIDAGNPAPPGGYPTCETTDQRGVARPEDGDSDGVARCDIGAYERRAVDGEPDGVIELPVAFQVTNSNTTSAACPFDNAEYTVRGSIVGPESAIYGPAPRAVTVYVHGFSQSEGNWAFTAVPGYDLPVEMAKLGHISLNINRPGYSPSDHPPGMLSCVGTAADVTHQIIGQLRSPGATLPDGEHVSFSKIVLAGHDSGGTMVEVEAYSYKDIDGLFVSSFADTGFSQRVTEWSVEAGALCMQGGELSDRGAPNYHTFPPIPDEEFANDEALLREIFYNTDEAVFQAIKQSIATGGRQLNPCGDIGSVPGAVASNLARLHEVTVPVLYLLGDHDIGFTKEGGERQGALYSGSDDVTSLIMEDTPHFWMWGRTAPDARSMVSEWLCSRGFVSAGSACGSEAGHR